MLKCNVFLRVEKRQYTPKAGLAAGFFRLQKSKYTPRRSLRSRLLTAKLCGIIKLWLIFENLRLLPERLVSRFVTKGKGRS